MAAKNKKAKANLFSEIFNTKAKIIITCIIAAVVILAAIFLIVQEGSYGKLTVKNNTGLDLEFLKTSFVGDEGTVDKGLQTGRIAAGEKLTVALEPAELEFTESNLEIAFKLAGLDEMFTDVGYFNQRFTGNINISFNKTKDPDIITIKIKAANGLFQSSTVNCDEEFEIDLKMGIILD